MTTLGGSHVNRGALQDRAAEAFAHGDIAMAAQLAQAAGLYAIVEVLERIENIIERIDHRLDEARDPGAP